MSDQQRRAFDQWFDSELDPELNLTPGDKELCRHAWQAALSHAEGEEVPAGYLSVLSDGTRIVDGWPQYDAPEVWPLYTHPTPQVAGWRSGYPEYDGDGGVCHIPLDGYPDFMVVAFNSDGNLVDSCGDDVGYGLEDVERWRPIDATPTKGEEIHVNVDGDSVYTLPLEPTGMAAPRFVVHVPAPDEREIADWLSREIGFANAYTDKHKVSPNPEARAIMVGRTQALQEVRDKLSTRLRAGKEGE